MMPRAEHLHYEIDESCMPVSVQLYLSIYTTVSVSARGTAPPCIHEADAACHVHAGCYGTRSPLKNIRARGRIIFLFFPRVARARALKIRQINNTIFKVPDAAWSC
jgi:hypothetical protein